MSNFAKYFFLIGIFFLSYIGGVISEHYRPYPYYQIYNRLTYSVKKVFAKTYKEIDKIRKIEKPLKTYSRPINTAYLPLNLETIEISKEFPIFGKGGAIAYIDDKIFLVDNYSNFAINDLSSNKVKMLDWPSVYNGNNSLKDILTEINPNSLRIMSLFIVDGSDQQELIVYCSYDALNDATGYPQVKVSQLRIDRNSLAPIGSWEIIFEGDAPAKTQSNTPNWKSNGGQLFVDDNSIFLTLGDYNLTNTDPVPEAQNPSNSHGSTVIIDRKSLKSRTFSIGHRNSQGIWRLKGVGLYSVEHGPKGGDELNLLVDGGNYGWPYETFGTNYGSWSFNRPTGSQTSNPPPPPNFIDPMYAWIPSIAVSSVVGIEAFSEKWTGNLLAGSLKAKSLYRIKLDAQGKKVVYVEKIPIGERIREAIEVESKYGKYIAMWTGKANLLLLSVDENKMATDSKTSNLPGRKILSNCLECHHLGPTYENQRAPSLSGIIGRPIAADKFSSYSTGLKSMEGVWTKGNLKEFLTNPQSFAQGSIMPNPQLKKSDLKKIINVLGELN